MTNPTHSSSSDPGLTAATSSPAESGSQTSERAGTSIGPYLLIAKLGDGGMGSVWLAEQSLPVKRQVAIKVIKPGMLDDEALMRFDLERQSMALMNHPAIAKVFDAVSCSVAYTTSRVVRCSGELRLLWFGKRPQRINVSFLYVADTLNRILGIVTCCPHLASSQEMNTRRCACWATRADVYSAP